MNMHGIMTPVAVEPRRRRVPVEDVIDWIRRRRMFLLIVVLPSLLLAGYLYLIASDQYESEAHFIVRSADAAPAAVTGVGAALSMVTGHGDASHTEAMSVADYLTSHDAVAELRRGGRLVERYNRADADFFSRLRQADPTPEKLLKFYRKRVSVQFSTETGITTLKVHSFRPEDSYDLVRMLLRLGEQRVNILNQRSYSDAIETAQRQLADTETKLEQVQGRLTSFRQNRRDIDPQASGQAQIGLVTNLTGQLSAARAQLSAMGRMIAPSSPQYQAVAARVRALEAQVAGQSGRLTGGNRAIATDISGYEGLQLRQQFLAKRYEAAASALDRAREQALRQQLYLVRVVDANRPVKAMFPERARILGTVMIVLFLVYSIGWLLVAGVREHAQ